MWHRVRRRDWLSWVEGVRYLGSGRNGAGPLATALLKKLVIGGCYIPASLWGSLRSDPLKISVCKNPFSNSPVLQTLSLNTPREVHKALQKYAPPSRMRLKGLSAPKPFCFLSYFLHTLSLQPEKACALVQGRVLVFYGQPLFLQCLATALQTNIFVPRIAATVELAWHRWGLRST